MMYINHVSLEHRLKGINLELPLKQQIHIIGPNGSGKSSLLAVLAGVTPFDGDVTIGGLHIHSMSLSELSRIRSYLAQNEKPVFNITVHEYLRLSLPIHVTLKEATVTEVVNHLIDLMGVRDKLAAGIHQLSGGEWQRVRIIGCCLQVWPQLNPDGQLLILDEPAAPLDIGQEKYLYALLKEAVAEGLSIVMANHDLNRVLNHSEYTVLLSKSRLVTCGKPTEVVCAENIRTIFNTDVQEVDIEGKRYLIFD